MLAAEHYSEHFADVVLPKQELLEIHRSKVSLHHAKCGYDYPSIRLPHTFNKLAGLSTKIYQTIYEGALAFLVVISSKENASKHPKPPSSHGGGRVFESPTAEASLIARVVISGLRYSRNPALF